MTKGAIITRIFLEKSSLFDVDLFSQTFYVEMPYFQDQHIPKGLSNKQKNHSKSIVGPASAFRWRSPLWQGSVKGLVSLLEAWPPSESSYLPVRGPASLSEGWPALKRPGLPVSGLASLWGAWPPCKRAGLQEWVARPPFEQSRLPVSGPASRWATRHPCFPTCLWYKL